MRFAELFGTWIAAFAIPLIALYLLKVRRTEKRVGSTWLWQQAERDLKAQHPFRRLRFTLPLLLQLALLALLTLAAMRPFTLGNQFIDDHTAILFDVSASMQAKEADGKSRLDLAKSWARDTLDRSATGAEVMLISAGSGVRVITPFERDRARLLQAVDTIAAEDAEGSLHAAVELAAARLRRVSGKRRIVLLTDGAWANRTPLVSGDVPLEVVAVGTPLDNVGIIHVDTRLERDPATGRTEVRVFARVKNFSDKPTDRFVTLRQRNVKEPLTSRNLRLLPDEDAPVLLSFEATPADEGTGLIIELDAPDAFTADDRAYAVVPEGRHQRVLMLEARKSPWLERALLADPEVEVLRAESESAMQGARADGAFLVYSGLCPRSLPRSHFLIVDPDEGPCLTTKVGAQQKSPKITSWRETDPRLRFLNLAEIQIQAARVIATDSDREMLLRSQSGAIITQLDLRGRQGTLVGFDFADTDWPLKASFVLFVRNLVEHAREHRLTASASALRAGMPHSMTVPLDVQSVDVAWSEGDYATSETPPAAQTLSAKLGVLTLPAVTRAGFHQISFHGETPRSALLAVSLVSDKESELRARALPQTVSVMQASDSRGVTDLVEWYWLLALVALSVLVLEVTVSLRNRRAVLRVPKGAAAR